MGYDDAGGYWIAKNSWGSSWNGNWYSNSATINVTQNSQISWTQSSLPVTYDHFNHLPVILNPDYPPGAFGKMTPANGVLEQPAGQYLMDWSIQPGPQPMISAMTDLDGECTGGWIPLSGAAVISTWVYFSPGIATSGKSGQTIPPVLQPTRTTELCGVSRLQSLSDHHQWEHRG